MSDIVVDTFRDCSFLKRIDIPESVERICDGAFCRCTALTDIAFAGTKRQWDKIVKETNRIKGAGNLTVHCADGDIRRN